MELAYCLGNVREKILSGETVVFKEQNMYLPVLIDRILY